MSSNLGFLGSLDLRCGLGLLRLSTEGRPTEPETATRLARSPSRFHPLPSPHVRLEHQQQFVSAARVFAESVRCESLIEKVAEAWQRLRWQLVHVLKSHVKV